MFAVIPFSSCNSGDEDEDLIFASSVVSSGRNTQWVPLGLTPATPVLSEKDRLINKLKQRSPQKLVAILHELVKEDVLKTQAERLFPRLRTRCKIWFMEREREPGMALPATPAMDLDIERNISFTRLPLKNNWTSVAKVLFCYIQTHGKEEKAFTFAAVQCGKVQTGGDDIMHLNVGLSDSCDKRWFMDRRLFLSIMDYMSTHVTHLIFFSPTEVAFFKSVVGSKYTTLSIGPTLSQVLTGTRKKLSLEQLLIRFASGFEYSDKLPAAARWAIKQYRDLRGDDKWGMRKVRMSITNAKTLFFLYDKLRDRVPQVAASFPK